MENWIEQWLIDIRQMVGLDGEVSVVKEVPEISVLGRIIFLRYINLVKSFVSM